MSKVTDVQLWRCRVSARTDWFMVRLETADETVGYGECSDAGPLHRATVGFAQAAGRILGRDAVREREQIIDDLLSWRSGLHDKALFTAATVLGGLEQALCDVAARQAGEPLWRWLGGAEPHEVPLYANINRVLGGRSPAQVADAARAAVRAGFSAVKCAPFDVAADDGAPLSRVGIARTRAVRAAVGDAVDVMVDCHEQLQPAELEQVLEPLGDLGLYWLEDAVPIHRVDLLRELRQHARSRLAGGERSFAPEEVRAAVQAGLVDVLMPDVKHAGGLARARTLGTEYPSVGISPHNPCGPIATGHSAHLFVTCPTATVLEYAFGEVGWRSALVYGAERVRGGHLRLPEAPGLGLDLDLSHPNLSLLHCVN